MSLTPKQARFRDEYLVDLNATQAAIRAGYSKATAYSQGQRLLKHVEVGASITAAKAARSTRARMTADDVLREYERIARGDVRRVVQWGEGVAVKDEETGEARIVNGVSLIAAADLSDDDAAAISEIAQTKEGLRVKFHSKPQALDALAKHHGLFDRRAPGLNLPSTATAEGCAAAAARVLDLVGEGRLTLEAAAQLAGVIEVRRKAIETALAAQEAAALKDALRELAETENVGSAPRHPAA